MFLGRKVRADPHVVHRNLPLAITERSRGSDVVAPDTILGPQPSPRGDNGRLILCELSRFIGLD